MKNKIAASLTAVTLVLGAPLVYADSGLNHDYFQTEERNHVMENEDQPLKEPNPNADENRIGYDTKNVTRLNTSDPIQAAVMTAQTIWPATNKDNRPGAIVLAAVEDWQTAAVSEKLIHHPNDAPLLFTSGGALPELTQNEIRRLSPKGNGKGTHIFIMGNALNEIPQTISGYKITRVAHASPAAFAAKVDQTYTDISGKVSRNIIIGSSDDKAMLYTLPAINWTAHMPDPLLYVNDSKIPQATKEALRKRKGEANIYVIGPSSIIPDRVLSELRSYGKVTRIAGGDPAANSVAFARFKDPVTKFGWGINDPGHGLSFVSTSTPNLAIGGAPFAHMGKHAPLILLNNGQLTPNVYRLMMDIKPTFKDDPTVGPYNHSFLLGSTQTISFRVQGEIDKKLEIADEDMTEMKM